MKMPDIEAALVTETFTYRFSSQAHDKFEFQLLNYLSIYPLKHVTHFRFREWLNPELLFNIIIEIGTNGSFYYKMP